MKEIFMRAHIKALLENSNSSAKEFSPTEPCSIEWNTMCYKCKKTNAILLQCFEDGNPTEKFICQECLDNRKKNEPRKK